MKRYALGALFLLITFILLAFAFHSRLAAKDLKNRLNRAETEANALKDEVIRLQEVAIAEAARARAAEAQTLRLTEETIMLQTALDKCNGQ